MRRIAAVLVVCLVSVLACEGPTGPMGPEGPEGPQGPAGSLAVQVRTATVGSDRAATVVFEGLRVQDILVNYWTSSDPSGPWLKVGFAADGPVCGAGNGNNGVFVSILDGVPGWIFLATAATSGT